MENQHGVPQTRQLTIWVFILWLSMAEATGTKFNPGEQEEASGIPVFYSEPEVNYYVPRRGVVKINCKASPASWINFTCAGKIMSHKSENQEIVDEATGVKYIEASVEVAWRDVIDYAGDYECECIAWDIDAQGQAKSSVNRKRRVEIAYLRRRFNREPMSAIVAFNSSLTLLCRPPSGRPQPKVFWLKDGEPIDASTDQNYIISDDSLHIKHARLSNAGRTYSCVAENIAARRYSRGAFVLLRGAPEI